MNRISLALTAFAIILFAACSQKATPTKNVVETQKETPKAVVVTETPKSNKVTYEGAVQPLILAKCTPCHLPSKGGRKADFETFGNAVKYSADMVIRIQENPGEQGFMPFKGAKLSADEIAVFKKWLSDGFQEK